MPPIAAKIVFFASIAVLGAAFVLFYLDPHSAGNFLIIGADSLRGTNFFGSANQMFGILLVGAMINLINIILSAVLDNRERFLANILPFAALLVSLLILIAVGVTITINQ